MKRITKQFLIPEKKGVAVENNYEIYPSHKIVNGKIESGYESLVNELGSKKTIILDGHIGLHWKEVVVSFVKDHACI